MPQDSNTDMNNLHSPEKAQVEEANAKSIEQEWQESQDKTSASALELVDLKNKYAELDDQYKRLWADQQNMVSRFNRDRVDLLKYAASNTLEAILPALDNFDFARKSINENTRMEDILKSFEMLQDQLISSLRSVGLEEINTKITYNPELHEAVHKIVDASKPEGTILEVLKKGFKVHDKVLRVATVVVSTKE